ncbi:MAG: hypothetical protein ACRD3O_04080 [Terriglobia bacterium]
MKILKLISLAVMCVFLAATVPGRAQDQNHKKETKQSSHQEHARPAQRGRQAERGARNQTRQQGRQAQRGARAQTQQRARQVQRGARTQTRQRAMQARSPRGRQAGSARSARNYHGRIPYSRYHERFGREHRFRVNHFVMFGGHRRFLYGGYWFQLGAPWPMGWAYTSPFYIEWLDGQYWMFNPMYPGVRVALIVVP